MNIRLWHLLSKPWLYTYRLLSSGRVEQGFRILTFHNVQASEKNAFERIIDFILEHHGVLTPLEVEGIIDSAKMPAKSQPPCLITFDDGYASNVDAARTVLNARGIKALFFVCPALMDIPVDRQNAAISHHVYEGHPVPSNMRLASWRGLESLLEAGHTIGSHTLSHSRLSQASPADRVKEIVDSGNVLQERLKLDVQWFAYPFGTVDSIDKESYEIIAKRYKYCCTGVRGLNRCPINPLGLLRDSIDLSAPFDYQRLSLCGGLDFLYKKAARRIRFELCPAK